MDLTQFFFTFTIAFLVGIATVYLGQTVWHHLAKFYRKWTFRHKLLIPYQPTNKSD